MCVWFEAFSKRFVAFDDSPNPKDPVCRSLKKLAEGTHRMLAEWTTTRKVGDSCLADALAGRDGASRGHFLTIPPTTRPTTFETYSKNLP